MKLDCYVVSWNGDRLQHSNGVEIAALPRGNGAKQTVFFVLSPAPWHEILSRYGKAGDMLCGPKRGRPAGMNAIGGLRLMSADVWGIETAEDLAVRMAAVSDIGEDFTASASSLSVRIANRIVKSKQLPPRWRWLAVDGMHQGPMVVCQASMPEATEVDRVAAYLNALRAPMPVRDSWVSAAGMSLRSAMRCEGFLTCAVELLDTGLAIPPLPSRSNGFTVHGVGRFHGTWPIHWLRMATGMGLARIEHVYDGAICNVAETHAKVADAFESIADKKLRKLLYTRYWGAISSRGWWVGSRDRVDGSVLQDGIYWTFDGEDFHSSRMRATYRPDVGAFVCADNAVRVHSLIASTPAEDVAMAHVDAVWIRGNPTIPAGWAAKGSGPFRGYSIGAYTLGEVAKASGIPRSTLNPSKLDAIMRNVGAGFGTVVGRQWNGDPAIDPHATSHPVQLSTSYQAQTIPTWQEGAWTPGGWKVEKSG